MKYYIGEYWAMANSADSKTREEGELKWIETAEKYGPYFETVKNKLPKHFMKEFTKSDWFHDFIFESISIINKGNRTASIEFVITHGKISYKLIFAGVTGFMFDVPNTMQCWSFGKLTLGYIEFELNDDGTWIISILCDIYCEIEIHFRRISIRKL